MRVLRILSLSIALFATLAALSPGDAHAKADWTITDKSAHVRPMNLDATGHFGPWSGVGAAVWFAIPVVPDGFIPSLNDSFDVEFGSYITYFAWAFYTDFVALVPMGGVRWKFHLTPDWTVFATAKMGWRIAFTGSDVGGFDGLAGVGAYWHFSEDLYMRLELGRMGIEAGVGMPL